MKTGKSIGLVVSAAALAGLAGAAHGQAFHELIGTQGNEAAFGMAPTRDGGYLIAGQIQRPGQADTDWYIVRLRPNGTILWDLVWGVGEFNERATNIRELPNGEITAVGELSAFGPVLNVGALRISAAGIPLSCVAFEGDLGSEDPLNAGFAGGVPDIAMDVLPDGQVVLVGRKLLSPNGSVEPQIALLNPAHIPVYNLRLTDPAQQFRQMVFTDIDMPEPFNPVAAISGTINVNAVGAPVDRDVLLTRFDVFAGAVFSASATGIHTPGVIAQEFGDAVDATFTSDAVISGRTDLAGLATPDAAQLIRFDVGGGVLVNNAFELPGIEIQPQFAALHQARDGTFIVGGQLRSAAFPSRATLWRVDPGFNPIWHMSYADRTSGRDAWADFGGTEPSFLTAGAATLGGLGIGATDVYALRTIRTGRTGCLEERYFPNERRPDLRSRDVELRPEPMIWTFVQAPWQQNVGVRKVLCEGLACPADINGDGTVDLADFFDFFNCYDNNLPCGDVNNDGTVDLADFFEFFGLYDTGC